MQRLTEKMLKRGAAGDGASIGAHRRAGAGNRRFPQRPCRHDAGDRRGQPVRARPSRHSRHAGRARRGAGARRYRARTARRAGARLRDRLAHRHRLETARHHASARHVGNGWRCGRRRAPQRRDAATKCVETINVASTLGLATSRRTMLEGGTVRNSFAGFSNEIGLRAWDMVEAGFVGETDGVGTIFGSVAAENFQPQEMIDDLGARWEIARNYFKRHAACRYNHGAIDALLSLVASGGRRDRAGGDRTRSKSTPMYGPRSSTGRSRATCSPPNSRFPSRSRPPSSMARLDPGLPRSRARGRDYARAGAARDREGRSRADLDAAGPAPGARRHPLEDGRTLKAEALTNKGDTEDPYSAEEIREKFHEVTGPVWSEARRHRILAAVDRIIARAR